MVGLRSSLVTRNMPDLPANLDLSLLNECKAVLLSKLNKKYNNDTEAKIVKVKRILEAFKTGRINRIDRTLNFKENWWATRLVLFELEINGKEA